MGLFRTGFKKKEAVLQPCSSGERKKKKRNRSRRTKKRIKRGCGRRKRRVKGQPRTRIESVACRPSGPAAWCHHSTVDQVDRNSSSTARHFSVSIVTWMEEIRKYTAQYSTITPIFEPYRDRESHLGLRTKNLAIP